MNQDYVSKLMRDYGMEGKWEMKNQEEYMAEIAQKKAEHKSEPEQKKEEPKSPEKPKPEVDGRWIKYRNAETGEKVKEGYKRVRAKYIVFIKEYNKAKAAGCSLDPEELDALKKLHKMWTPMTFGNTLSHFSAMMEHKHLQRRFSDASAGPVHAAWDAYNQEGTNWRAAVTEAVNEEKET